MSIAYLGTGLLGSGMVQRLLISGGSVAVWNRTAARTAPLADAGARVASSPADALAGAVVIDPSTTSADGAAARGARLAAAGRGFLHAPVFMSPAAARDAKGMMIVAGDEALMRRLEPALSAMTGDLWYVGT